MDYFLSTAVQERVVNGLSMVSSVKNVARNPLIDSNKNFFDKKLLSSFNLKVLLPSL
jgi:hypothetical protein